MESCQVGDQSSRPAQRIRLCGAEEGRTSEEHCLHLQRVHHCLLSRQFAGHRGR